jgi:hypothetical protein
MSDKKRTIKRVPKPSQEEIKKIKASMNLRANDPLPKCPAKCTTKAKSLGGEHLDAGHRCGDCQCKHVAGMGTKHYGTGYCVFHDNAKKYKGSAMEVAHRQKVSCQQGYPNEIYKYESEQESFEAIRISAEAAKGRHEVREEVVVLKATLQKYIKQIDEKLGTSGYVSDENITSITKLTSAIAKLAHTELEVTDVDYVHKDEITAWLYAIMRSVQEGITDLDEQVRLLKRISLIPQPTTGHR